MITQTSRRGDAATKTSSSLRSASPTGASPGDGSPARPRFHDLTGLPGLRARLHRLRLPLAALALAAAFTASTRSATETDDGLTLAALRAGADRLVALQHDDGSWGPDVDGPGSLLRSGAPARALVLAARAHDDPRYLEAARRTARALLTSLDDEPELATTANLLFLAELATEIDDEALLEATRRIRTARLGHERAESPQATAAAWMARRNPTRWMDGAWKNYLLWSAGDVADLARACGDEDWADAFTLEVARLWAPKHDHQWWALGAGRLAGSLARVPGAEARRLEAAQLSLIRGNELRPGLPWNDTPYDAYAYTQEAATVLSALALARDESARERGRLGLRVLAARQAGHGGWGTMFSLLEHAVPEGHADWVPPAELAAGETPEQDAAVVTALALAHGARPAGQGTEPPSAPAS